MMLRVDRDRYKDPPEWPPKRRVFVLYKLRRAVAIAMPYLLAVIVCAVLVWLSL